MTDFSSLLRLLVQRKPLDEHQVHSILAPMLAGTMDEVEAAVFLVALRMKGETPAEVAAAAQLLRQNMRAFDLGLDDAIDTCGTGGDGSGTFNVSTATAFVVAGAGVPVVKHGNRSVSSKSGSADVLQELGVRIDGDADFVRRCVHEIGMGFCFAPQFHPAMKNVGPVRRKLGIPTIFNLLGPLANPTSPPYQVLGVGKPELLDVLSGALSLLKPRRALVLHGEDGLDEISLAAPTHYRLVTGNTVTAGIWRPEALGLTVPSLDGLLVDGPRQSAERVTDVLRGKPSAALEIVLANSAAALWVAGRADSIGEGVRLARSAVTAGKAENVLTGLRRLSSSAGA